MASIEPTSHQWGQTSTRQLCASHKTKTKQNRRWINRCFHRNRAAASATPAPQTLPCLGVAPGNAAVVVGCLPQAAVQQWQWAGASGSAKECLPDLWMNPSMLTVVWGATTTDCLHCWPLDHPLPHAVCCCGAIVGTTRS